MEQSDSKPQIPQQGTIPSESNLHVAPPPPKNSASASLKTPVVIFKIISVILGLLALILAAYGWCNANLFHLTNQGKICDWSKKDEDDWDEDESCQDGDYYRDQICQNYNEFHKANKTDGYLYEPRVCPSRSLVVSPVIIIGIVWLVTLPLIVLLFKQRSKSLRLSNVIFHILAGCLTVGSSLCLIAFFRKVNEEDMCSEENLRTGFDYIEVPNNRTLQRSTYSDFVLRWQSTIVRNFPTFSFNPNSNSRQFASARATDSVFARIQSECPAYQDKLYLRWFFLSAGLFGLITGVLYCVVAMLSKPTRQSGYRIAGGYAWAMPQSSQMYQQQSYYGSYQQEGYGHGYVEAPHNQPAYPYPQNR